MSTNGKTNGDHLARGPHSAIETSGLREQMTAQLLDQLWVAYRDRVPYVQTYEKIVADAGGTFVNDHIAFRTIAYQEPPAGRFVLARLFQAMGYVEAGSYHFADKQLSALHLQHPNPKFPKIFISELQTWALPFKAQRIINRYLQQHRMPVSLGMLRRWTHADELSAPSQAKLLRRTERVFQRRPWRRPLARHVEAINEMSQYAAWTLVHGYAVNHFTALINSHGVESLNSIEKTIEALSAAGVPMKDSIEGEAGSKLRQSATQAVTLKVPVRQRGKRKMMDWTYAYFELAERGNIKDAQSGDEVRFEGFLGPQATQLFEMTRR